MTKEQQTTRVLYTVLSSMLAQLYSYREIAEYFYINGIIDDPEFPNMNDWKSKKDYCLVKLSQAKSNQALLRSLGQLVFEAEFLMENRTTDKLPQVSNILKSMGYKEKDIHEGIVIELIPPSDLSAYDTPYSKEDLANTTPADPSGLVFNLYGHQSKINFHSQDSSVNTLSFDPRLLELDEIIESNPTHPKSEAAKEELARLKSPGLSAQNIVKGLGRLLSLCGDIAGVTTLVTDILSKYA